MRVLGLETSSPRGSAAVVQDGVLVARAVHDEPLGHGERMLPLVERVLREARWSQSSLERVAVGLGPGSFTGIRVGIALAQGIAAGLGVPVVGVESLRTMAAAVPTWLPGARCALLDARRDELFAAAYDVAGEQLLAPCVIARSNALATLAARLPGPRVLVGAAAAGLDSTALLGAETDWPDAAWTARIGERIATCDEDVQPVYVRPPDLVLR